MGGSANAHLAKRSQMNRIQYAEACKRTSKGLNTKNERLSNFALGLVGEASELNELINYDAWQGKKLITKISICKESGDVFWYMFRLVSIFGDDYDSFILAAQPLDFIPYTPYYDYSTKTIKIGSLVENISILAGKIADEIKKVVFHQHELKAEKILPYLAHMYYLLEFLLRCFGMTVEEVFEKNIEKLRERYPNGFSTDSSIARVDESTTKSDNDAEQGWAL